MFIKDIDLQDQLNCVASLSIHLEKFKKQKQYNWYFRCPYCGDSENNPHKLRGNIFLKGDSLRFYCFNCGKSKSFVKFVKDIDQDLFTQLVGIFHKKTDKSETPKYEISKKTSFVLSVDRVENARKISDLHRLHPAKIYLNSRKIPNFYLNHTYYTSDLKKWVFDTYPNIHQETIDKYPNKEYIIIPFFDKDNKIMGHQFRSLSSEKKYRYLTLKLREDIPMFFGANLFDNKKTGFLVEGPIDSFFIDNCLAAASSNLYLMYSYVRNYLNSSNIILVFDNEPKNKEIRSLMSDTIKKDRDIKLFFWPYELKKYKDINDWFLDCEDSKLIESTIIENSFSGLAAMSKFNIWKNYV